ncbi:hypothetical protein BDN67DRAFT_916895, partial [Paxillus ammoniavirescens]
LVYLPPYSPDFNLIEETFHFIKAWLRRHEDEVVSLASNPWLVHQATMSVTPDLAQGWFHNCAYD